MTAKERIRNILILEEMQKNPKEVKRLGLVELGGTIDMLKKEEKSTDKILEMTD